MKQSNVFKNMIFKQVDSSIVLEKIIDLVCTITTDTNYMAILYIVFF